MKIRQWMFAAAACAALATQAVDAAPQARWTLYQIAPMRAPGSTTPLDINDRGQVVGYGTASDPVQVTAVHAFLWENGTTIDLGRAPTGYPLSSARAINDRGTVLGGDGLGAQFTWSDGVWTPLSVPGRAQTIDFFGAIGGAYGNGSATHGYISRDGVVTDIGTLGGGYSEVDAMNDRGVAVGKSLIAGNTQYHPYVYEKGVMRDLGTFGGTFGVALGVNSHGEVVGAANDAANQQFAFIYDGIAIRKLLADSSEPSQAVGINDHGTVIGWFEGGAGLSFVHDDGVLTMLDQIPEVRAAGLSWLVPTAINNRGWITGYGRTASQSSVGFVLVPK